MQLVIQTPTAMQRGWGIIKTQTGFSIGVSFPKGKEQ